jgi:hypothetical protein
MTPPPSAPPGPRRRVAAALALSGLAASLAATTVASAQSLSSVPGVVISYEPSPNPVRHLLEQVLGRGRFIGSPTIAVLPNGHYVAAHDLFRNGGAESPAGRGTTKVFRSTDRGRTWRRVAQLQRAGWSTLFEHMGSLYLFGKTLAAGDIVIRRSDDEGATWTDPADARTGLLGPGSGTTPNPPVIHGGRLWIANSTRVWSAPVGADLLQAASWTRSGGPRSDPGYLNGRFTIWTEGQVVASPVTGVLVLPKIKDLPNTALLRYPDPARGPVFDPAQDFVHLPGAEKKFGVRYDPVSQRFWALTNPVLRRHQAQANVPWSIWRFWRKPVTPALVRNAAAIYSSADLRTWEFEQVFLYSPDVEHVGFQYLNFLVEGNDLLVVSRTAYNVGRWDTPRAHDSNLLTFHRVSDFRTRPANQYPAGSGLTASTGAP